MKRKSQQRHRQPGRHAKLASVGRRLIGLNIKDSDFPEKFKELQKITREILSGNWGNPSSLREAQEKGRTSSVQAAHAYALLVEPHIAAARKAGAKTLADLCDYLNEKRVYTRWGFAWHPATIRVFLQKLEKMNAEDAEL